MKLDMSTILMVIEQKWRFPSNKGQLSLEALYDLPLTGTDYTNLDQVAMLINDEIITTKAQTGSFVNPSLKTKFDLEKLNIKLEIVKHIINQKQEEKERKRQKTEISRKRETLEKLIVQKQLETLSGMSVDEIQEQIDKMEEETKEVDQTPEIKEIKLDDQIKKLDIIEESVEK